MAAIETTYCPNCGEQISARAKFCPSCGARQDDFRLPASAEAPPEAPAAVEAPAAPDPPPAPAAAASAEPEPESPPVAAAEPAPDPPAAGAPTADAPRREARPLHERIGEVDPQAAELTQLIGGGLALPGMIAAGLAALAAAAAVLLIAVITPDRSLIGVLGQGVGVITEAFRQAVGTLLAPVVVAGPFNSGSGRLTPMLFLAIPLVAVALATRWQMHRTADARPLVRLGWAAVVAVPFSLLMLAFAILGGHSDTSGISISAGGAFGLGLLWGAVGGVAGAAPALDWSAERTDVGRPWMRAALAGAAAALRPLAAVLLVCAALGLVAWLAPPSTRSAAAARRPPR